MTGLAPGVPAVACFDTAVPRHAAAGGATYAVPAEWRERPRRPPLRLPRAVPRVRRPAGGRRRRRTAGRIVTCHLGAGASLAAVRDGRCVDTTMGFTPLEGLVMATRSGTVDPGAVLWLVTHTGLDPGAVADALEHRSGCWPWRGPPTWRRWWRGRAGATPAADARPRRLRAPAAGGDRGDGRQPGRARRAGVHRRASARTPPPSGPRRVAGLGFLGVALDPDATTRRSAPPQPDADVTAGGSTVRTLVVAAREDLEIARGVRARLR